MQQKDPFALMSGNQKLSTTANKYLQAYNIMSTTTIFLVIRLENQIFYTTNVYYTYCHLCPD
jgi:hypothetical protein